MYPCPVHASAASPYICFLIYIYIYTILALHIFYLCCARRLFKRPQMQRTKYVDSFVGSSAVIQLHVAGTPEEGKKGARVS